MDLYRFRIFRAYFKYVLNFFVFDDFMKTKNSLSLLVELIRTDIKLKYTNSIFGYFWMLASPTIMLVTLYIIFSAIIKFKLKYYQIFLMLGIIIWNYFSEATTKSLNSFKDNSNILKKYRVKPYILIIAANGYALVSFFCNLIVLSLMMLYFRIEVFTSLRLVGLFYLILLFILTLGISFIIST